MTGTELMFLVLGLVLGVAGGVAWMSVRRARPRPSGEVRVTVTTDAIPRRSATLANDTKPDPAAAARGGPADHVATPAPGPGDRTPVRSVAPGAVQPPSPSPSPRAEPPGPRPADAPGAGPSADGAPTGAGRQGESTRMVPVPMGGGVDPVLDALRGPGPRATTAVLDRSARRAEARPRPVAAQRWTTAGSTAAGPDATPVAAGSTDPRAVAQASEPAAAVPEATGAARESPSGPCAELRMVADERCEVASRARLEAERAQDTLRAAQRSYDEHLSRAEAATRAADPRSVRAAKDAAQDAFRAARTSAGSSEAVDAAARDWLIEVNRINADARSAAADATRQQEAARALAGSLDRLTVEADAARIAAAAADEACLTAREAAADCDEAAIEVAAAVPPTPTGAPILPWLDADAGDASDGAGALRAGTAPTIFRLLEGDRDALGAVVARLAGEEADERRRWQLELSNLVDAILATAIEGAALEFPEEHPFWGLFTAAQSRDIVAALASLGYRFDGLGGWQDGRVPSQRDLSLALGYAGEDPMRMRHWPNEAEMATLFEPVRVAAPEYLAGAAGDLTLGELVAMLGPRADGLTEVWNAWGRVRPLLLEER